MKFKDLKKSYKMFFSLDKKERYDKKSEIDNIINKLHEKRKTLKKKIKKEDNYDKKEELNQKLNAVEKLIKKAKKNLY